MNIDIRTEHISMRPEWHGMIDGWIERCERNHPEVAEIDLTLRHCGNGQPAGEMVDVMATADGRTLHAAGKSAFMDEALHEALNGIEREVLVHEAARHRPQLWRPGPAWSPP